MDRYDTHIEHLLTLSPEEVQNEWDKGRGIFGYAGNKVKNNNIGCLTTIRRNVGCMQEAETPELTAAIRADNRIPDNSRNITPKHYPIFAEWHRRIDRELGR